MNGILKRVAIVGFVVLAIGLLVFSQSHAQRPIINPQPINPARPALPVLPRLEPRPAASPQVPFRTKRKDKEREPVSSFFDSVRGSDAVIEVIVGQARILTTKKPIATKNGIAVVAVGEPTILDFDLLPNPQMIRIIGSRVGVTDLTIVSGDGDAYSFEVHVLYDLHLINAQLRQIFPDALISIKQLREHVVVEGQVRSAEQASKVIETLTAYLNSIQTPQQQQVNAAETGAGDEEASGAAAAAAPATRGEDGQDPLGVVREEGGQRPQTQATFVTPRIINLLQVPVVQQVLLKVQVAELNRQAAREIGTDLTFTSQSGNFLQSIATGGGNLVGIFPNADFSIVLNALRRNSVVTVLAEPNLITLSGHAATFQSGGEFPVPVAQQGGGAGNNSVQFKDFGVLLNFTPYVQDSGIIRLRVAPEVSNVDDTLSVTLIQGGDAVPGVRTRNVSTTVDLRQGQTLAIAGLLNRDTQATTARVPWLGDLPYLGSLFSDNSHEVNEQELLVLVTPYLVGPLSADERPPLPGHDIAEPNNLEFYLLNRIEGRTGRPFRSTTNWDDPFGSRMHQQFEQTYLFGPVGHTR